jgi:large subunit ribosomal protein L6
MSRIGKKPIVIPAGVTVTLGTTELSVKGPKGELKVPMQDQVTATIQEGQLVFERHSEVGPVRAAHGLCRALARNAIQGVSAGFTRKLLVQGIGYKTELQGSTLVLNLGYSHPIRFPIPKDVQIAVEGKDNSISVSGSDRGRVGQVCAIIRGFRPPDRYKGKGVRYEGEHVALKEGKSA